MQHPISKTERETVLAALQALLTNAEPLGDDRDALVRHDGRSAGLREAIAAVQNAKLSSRSNKRVAPIEFDEIHTIIRMAFAMEVPAERPESDARTDQDLRIENAAYALAKTLASM